MNTKFRKKPVEIEAMQFTDETKDMVYNFVRCNHFVDFEDGEPIMRIQTREGEMTARFGDWIIKGVAGEFYPCKPDIFKATYECKHGKGLTDYCEPCERINGG